MPDIDHRRLATIDKTLSITPAWQLEDMIQGSLILAVPLDIDFVAEEGLELEIKCRARTVNQGVSFVLKYKPACGLAGPLARLDWNPTHVHSNKRLGRREWRLKEIRTTHLHPFEDNFDRGWKRMVLDNLPIAYPIPEMLATFRDALGLAGSVMRIHDIQRISEPPWFNVRV